MNEGLFEMKKILIIESVSMPARELGKSLQDFGYTVEDVNTGESGFNHAVTENPDLVIIDNNLPDIEGIDLCKKLKKNKFLSPIIIITEGSEETIPQKGLKEPPDAWLHKPFYMKEVMFRIRSVLKESNKKEKATPKDNKEAKRIRERTLPSQLPEIKGLDIFSLNIPSMHTGGDFFDVFLTNEGKVGFVILDVCGKGLTAAMMIQNVSEIIGSSKERFTASSDILFTLQSEIADFLTPYCFLTSVAAIYNPYDETIEISRAGHPSPLFMREGKVREVDPYGIFIAKNTGGVFQSSLERLSLNFEPDSVLLFHSDGLTELKDKKRRNYGTDRLKSSLAKNNNYNAETIARNCLNEALLFADPDYEMDDITVICIKKSPN